MPTRHSRSADDLSTDYLEPRVARDLTEDSSNDVGHDQDEAEEIGTSTSSDSVSTQLAMLNIQVPLLSDLGAIAEDYELVELEESDNEPTVDSRVVEIVEDLSRNDGSVWYLVKFGDGKEREVAFDRLTSLENGPEALCLFTSGDLPDTTGGSAEHEALASPAKDPHAVRKSRLELLAKKKQAEISSRSETVETSDDDIAPRPLRSTRSRGLRKVQMLSYSASGNYSDEDIDDSDLIPTRKSGQISTRITAAREASKKSKRQKDDDSGDLEYESEVGVKRRSGRAKRPKTSYTEVDPDEEFESTEVKKPVKPRILHSKEIFPVLDAGDEFVALHNKRCDTCRAVGHSEDRGKLVHCQGCASSIHKECIGQHRSARDHLVTKITSENFVLQCKRCIGRYKIKDSLQASFDRCTDCRRQGLSCAPFKSLTAKKKAPSYDSRELTPNTKVADDLLYNPMNVLFRCENCHRAWHYDHLPPRGSRPDQDETADVRKARIQQYTWDFMCNECISAPWKISHILAWRPVDLASRQTGEEIELKDFDEDEREYLVKFEHQSYFHVQWRPGPWVSGAFAPKRLGFLKNTPNAILAQEEAIPEDWLRIEIVLDVEYTSLVPFGDLDVDLARIKEVKKAYVKFRGLGYDEVFWDEPPKESETERWNDWERAYKDFIHGKYVRPVRNLLKKVQKARSITFKKLELRSQPAYIKGGTLMQYQKEGMNWLYWKWYSGENAILADEMGLGKTIQVISFLSILYQEQKIYPFLIVVPHSTVPNWKREIQTWAPDLRVVAYFGADVARSLTRDYELFHENGDLKCHVVVTSYTTPISDSAILRRIPWQCLIVDEGQRLKNDSSLLYNELQKYKIQQKVLLTGTPLQNNPRELFNLLQFLEPAHMKAQDLEEEFGTLTSENVPKLHDLIRPFFLRRTKAQVLTHLPPMAEVIVPVSMTALQRKLYKSILSKDVALIKAILSKGDRIKPGERAKLNNLLMQLRKCVCHPYLYSSELEDQSIGPELVQRNLVEAGSKLVLLNIMLPKLKERGHRVLMFSQFLGMLDIIEDFLNSLGFKFHRLDGSVAALQKQKRIDEFNAPGSDYFAFLLSTRAGGVGINLATADTVIILDPDFNPHQDIQALSRAHRIGQKNKVLVFHLMTRDTAEEKIIQIGKKKLSLDHLIIEKMGNGEDGEEEETINVESILSFGAQRLFADEEEARIIKYDDESVDKLLDRSQIEQTTTEKGSAENAFSFARLWANDKGSLEETAEETAEDDTPEPSFWDKILKQGEEEARLLAAAKLEELGRGRRRKAVKYSFDIDIGDKDGSDTDYQVDQKDGETDEEDELDQPVGYADTDIWLDNMPASIMSSRPLNNQMDPRVAHLTSAAPIPRQISRPLVPSDIASNVSLSGRAPMVNLNVSGMTPVARMQASSTIPLQMGQPVTINPTLHPRAPPQARLNKPSPVKNAAPGEFKRAELVTPRNNSSFPCCKACKNQHVPGSCSLKLSGVELCPMCQLGHLPGACPHFKSETQLNMMLASLRDSNEDKEIVQEAKRHVRNLLKEAAKRKLNKSMKINSEKNAAAGHTQ
ncbi:chromodomain-helicase-DNA-binding protein 4 [Sphaerosporella brunnea]|uniref:Chromodomain-helicase-DNA-binding protein 4 n=1 Tax=Sphaerosporella brunnea TaxID=1250544 RepID=A0A5J5EWU1_9PEZI|nr:chromodomain-helicase-DNA-binding protein 4 [Sphaerosporella brunnea]